MDLTEEQLEEARQEIRRRDKAQSDAYAAEWQCRQNEVKERFWTGMLAKYPGLDRETMYDIYWEVRDFYE